MSELKLQRLNRLTRLNLLNYNEPDFDVRLEQLLAWEQVSDQQVNATVEAIITDVRSRGDDALIEYSQRFDGLSVSEPGELQVSQQRLEQALQNISQEQHQALLLAAGRIRDYHQHQVQQSWDYVDALGNRLGQQVTPLQRVGVYVPGGKAAYPSTVLMNVLPAKVAGVEQVIMVVPATAGELNDLVLAAAQIAGVDRVFTIGGAQAIAALAYGTQSVPKVDKIVGPGNIYVATAKRQVFGQVGIDMIAGPSEVLVVSDGSGDPDWIAMDLFSQAEHDEDAQAILVCNDADFLDAVNASMERLITGMDRAEIISASLNSNGAFILVDDIAQAITLANRIAPEHLELALEDAEQWLPQIQQAGAIFVGHHSPEALGDYCAGPNHVLPTSGTARFSSPLGVYDFQKRSSVIQCDSKGATELARAAAVLAQGEGLSAHARSAEYRIKPAPTDPGS